jgi:NCS1 family nucleobase:cation symporter-1
VILQMEGNLEYNDANGAEFQHGAGVDESLIPKSAAARNVGPIDYMFMWLGDGVNLGNMTLGSSLVVAGVATLNIF